MEQIIFNIGLIIILGILSIKILDKFKIPKFFVFLVMGIVLGPFGFNLISAEFLSLNQEISVLAIIILLVRAGLSLNRDAILKVGRPAFEMSCIPTIFEGLFITVIAHYILGISFIEAGMLGFILAPVASAILVPRMLSFIKKGYGSVKGIPTMLLVGSGADDVVAITIFSAFLSMYFGGNSNLLGEIIGIPVSIILGILFGLVFGYIVLKIFKHWKFSNVEKMLFVLGVAIFLNALEGIFEGIIPVAGLVGVMVVGFLIIDQSPSLGKTLSEEFSQIWFLAEIIVFVLLGAQLQLNLLVNLLVPGLIIVSLGLIARSIGVYISLFKTGLNNKEKLFCIIAYMPKANTQATIGILPLAAGVASGEIILAITGIAIIFTAPLGAILTEIAGNKLLSHDQVEN